MPEITVDHVIIAATAAAIGYLLGSIPFGLLLTKLTGQGDIRKIGSGNIGATNVLRTGKKGLALATLILDIAKGAAAVGIGYLIAPWLASTAGFFALLGHIFPVWLKFKGGKGVATAGGIFLAISWPVGVTVVVTWLAVALASRLSSLAALSASIIAPIAAWFFADVEVLLLTIFIAIPVWLKHHANIQRLVLGTEPKINLRRSGASE